MVIRPITQNKKVDTVIGSQSKGHEVLFTLVERKTRHFIMHKISGKTASAVTSALIGLQEEYGDQFSIVFKTITSDNGSEFSNLSSLEENSATKVYLHTLILRSREVQMRDTMVLFGDLLPKEPELIHTA